MCQKRKIRTVFIESTDMLCLARIMIHVMWLTSAWENNFSSWNTGAPFMSRRLLETSKKLLFWRNQLQVDSDHTGRRQISSNIIRFIYRYKDQHRSKKRLCNCICLTLNTFHISSMSILSANLPSLLDNKDTSPFKHESVTSFMLEAHLKRDDYKYYRSRTQNKTFFKCLGHPGAEVIFFFLISWWLYTLM